MLQSGFTNGGQSQDKVNDGRWCSSSRYRWLFFILVFGVVFFFYIANIKEKMPDWNHHWFKQLPPPKFFIPQKSQRQNVTVSYNNPKNSSSNHTSELTTEAGSSALTQTVTSAKNTSTPRRSTNPPVVIQNSLVPYVSPGPYLVEYPYEYHFVINEPQKCEEEEPFVVLMVPVAPNNRPHRDIIRSTWGSENLVQGKVVKMFFVLGLQTREGLQDQLLQESKDHRDLIQGDFLDCYKNLTIKTMVMLEWLNSYCSGATYAMKIDSDMFLNVPNLVNMLFNAPKTNYLTGLVARGAAVLRDPSSKWYLPAELYPDPTYPRYALGLGYILSLDLPKKLLEASRHVKALYIEDVYLGLCMQHLGIPPTDPPSWGHFNVFPVQYSRCAFSKLVATTVNRYTDRVWIWKELKKPGPYC